MCAWIIKYAFPNKHRDSNMFDDNKMGKHRFTIPIVVWLSVTDGTVISDYRGVGNENALYKKGCSLTPNVLKCNAKIVRDQCSSS